MTRKYPKGGGNLPLSEFSFYVKDLNQQEDRRLATELDKLNRRKIDAVEAYSSEQRSLYVELDLMLTRRTVPLDCLNIPTVRMAEIGYAVGITRRRQALPFSVLKRAVHQKQAPPDKWDNQYNKFAKRHSIANVESLLAYDQMKKRTSLPTISPPGRKMSCDSTSSGDTFSLGNLNYNGTRRHSSFVPARAMSATGEDSHRESLNIQRVASANNNNRRQSIAFSDF